MSNPRGSRSGPPASNRTNEYFVPKDGIDREVITADICRYLGNDALVRPGTYENPATRQVQQGYFITAYRNLTTEMIADLKADSARWDTERRQTASRGQSSGGEYSRDTSDIRISNTPVVEYRSSTTHQSRQYYGPTDASSAGYATPQAQVQSQPSTYGGDRYSQPSVGSYSAQGYPPDSNYYVQGADLRPARGEVPPQVQIPPRTVYAQPGYVQAAPTYADSRSTAYYQPSPGSVAPQQQQYPTQQQPSDPFYGRGSYDPPSDPYEGGGYSQATMQSSTPAVAPLRSQREREPERDNRRHRHR